jgi:phage host-nuclease inhibitor protein Gam
MARPKKASAVLESIEECTAAMRKLAVATADREVLIGELDRAVAALKKGSETRLAALEEKREDLELQLRNYYMSHLAEVERDGKRSVELLYGAMGRRWSPPALKLLNKSWTWAAVRESVRVKWGMAFLRCADPDVDKDKVKDEIPEEQLSECGMKLHREETFYVDLARAPEAGA